jgi:hypothetical protein
VKYPFLTANRLILVDYLPGSSGQLLLRLWSELDARLMYDNDRIIRPYSITDHPASFEIDYDIPIPKKMTNWFLDRCEPTSVDDYMNFFEFLGTTMVALSQKWTPSNGTKFYETASYTLENHTLLYGLHTWEKVIPWQAMNDLGCHIETIKIIPNTKEGLLYQSIRCRACNPIADDWWDWAIAEFNSNKNATVVFDFCSLLANKDSVAITSWLSNRLGSNLRVDKLGRVNEILDQYYYKIVDNL